MYNDPSQSLLHSVLLGDYPEMEPPGHVEILFKFLGNRRTIFHSSCAILHSQGSLFLHTFANTYYLLVFR